MTAVMAPSQEWSALADGTADPAACAASPTASPSEAAGGSARPQEGPTGRQNETIRPSTNTITFDELRETIARRLMNCRADESPSSWRTLLEIVTRLSTATAPSADEAASSCLLWSVGIAVHAERFEVKHRSAARPNDDFGREVLSHQTATAAHPLPAIALPAAGHVAAMISEIPGSLRQDDYAGEPSSHRAGCHSSEPPLRHHFLRPQHAGGDPSGARRWWNDEARQSGSALGPAVLALRSAVAASHRRVSEALETFQRCSVEVRAAVEQVDRRHQRPNVESLPLPPWPDVDTDIDRWWFKAGLSPDARALPSIPEDLTARARHTAGRTVAAIEAWELAARVATCGNTSPVGAAITRIADGVDAVRPTPDWLTGLNGGCEPASLRSAEAAELRTAIADLDALVALELMTLARLATGVDGQGPLPAELITRFLMSPSRLGGDPGLRATARELCAFVLSPRFEAMVHTAEDRLDRDRRWRADRRAALEPLAAAARNHGPDARLVRAWAEVAMRVDTVEAELSVRTRQQAGRSGLNAGTASEQQPIRPRLPGACRPPARREVLAGAHHGPRSR